MIRRGLMLGALLAALAAGGTALAAGAHPFGVDLGRGIATLFGGTSPRLLRWSSPSEAVRRTMQDADCWATYRRHRAAGGAMAYQDFAHRCAAVRGFRR